MIHRPVVETPRRLRWLPAVLIVLFVVLLFPILIVLTMGAAGAVVFVGICVFAVVALQYLLWGWWLGRMLRQDADAEEWRE